MPRKGKRVGDAIQKTERTRTTWRKKAPQGQEDREIKEEGRYRRRWGVGKNPGVLGWGGKRAPFDISNRNSKSGSWDGGGKNKRGDGFRVENADGGGGKKKKKIHDERRHDYVGEERGKKDTGRDAESGRAKRAGSRP